MVFIEREGHILHATTLADGRKAYGWQSVPDSERVNFTSRKQAQALIDGNAVFFSGATVRELPDGFDADAFIERLTEERIRELCRLYDPARESLTPLQVMAAHLHTSGEAWPGKTGAQRQSAYAQRQRSNGLRQVSLWLNEQEEMQVRQLLNTLRGAE